MKMAVFGGPTGPDPFCSYQNIAILDPSSAISNLLVASPVEKSPDLVGPMPFFLGMILSFYLPSINHKADICHFGRSPLTTHYLGHFPKYHTTVIVIPSPKYRTSPRWSQIPVNILSNYGFFGSV